MSERVAQADGFEQISLAVRPVTEALDASRLELQEREPPRGAPLGRSSPADPGRVVALRK